MSDCSVNQEQEGSRRVDRWVAPQVGRSASRLSMALPSADGILIAHCRSTPHNQMQFGQRLRALREREKVDQHPICWQGSQ